MNKIDYISYNKNYLSEVFITAGQINDSGYEADDKFSIKNKKRLFEKTAIVHVETLFKVAMKFTRNNFDAENLVQETYMKAFRFFDYYKQGTNCRAWLLKIMYNTFINNTRKRKKESVSHDIDVIDYINNLKINNFSSVIEENLMTDILDEEICIALESLALQYRLPIIFADLKDISYADIGKILNIPIGTVKSRINRGRKLLRKKLHNYGLTHGLISVTEKSEKFH